MTTKDRAISDDVMQIVRQCLGLEENDASRDEWIKKKTPRELFDLCCAWKLGYPGWGDTLLSLAKGCGFDIPD